MSYRLYRGISRDIGAYRYLLYNNAVIFNMEYDVPKIEYISRKSPRPSGSYTIFEQRNSARYRFVKEFLTPRDAELYILEHHFEEFL